MDGLGLFPVTMIRKSLGETLLSTYSQTAVLDGDPLVLSHSTFLNIVKGASSVGRGGVGDSVSHEFELQFTKNEILLHCFANKLDLQIGYLLLKFQVRELEKEIGEKYFL